MVTEERGTFKRFARNSMQAALALPSTGGAVKDSFSAPPSSPVMAFFRARGWSLTAKVTPAGRVLNQEHANRSTTEDTEAREIHLCFSVSSVVNAFPFVRRSLCPHARRSNLLQSQLQNHATCPSTAHPCGLAGRRRAAIWSRRARSRRKKGRASCASSVKGGMVISPRNSRCSSPGAAIRRSSRSLESGARPLFAVSPPTLISISTRQFLAQLFGGCIQFFSQPQGIERIDGGEHFSRGRGFVGLQVTDHVPLGIAFKSRQHRLPCRKIPGPGFRRRFEARRRRPREYSRPGRSCSPPSA